LLNVQCWGEKIVCVAFNKRNRSESSTLAKHVWQSFYFLAMLDIIVWSSSVCVSSPDLVGPAADALFPLILCEQVLYQVFFPKLVYNLDTMLMLHFIMTQTGITFQQALPQLCLSVLSGWHFHLVVSSLYLLQMSLLSR
jgi:hypothetical protein